MQRYLKKKKKKTLSDVSGKCDVEEARHLSTRRLGEGAANAHHLLSRREVAPSLIGFVVVGNEAGDTRAYRTSAKREKGNVYVSKVMKRPRVHVAQEEERDRV